MAENPIAGKELLFFIDVNNGTDYNLVVCLTNQSFERVANVIDATSKCGTNTLNGTKTRTIQIEGQVIYAPDAPHISEDTLDNIFENDTRVSWKWGRAIPQENDVIYSGVDALLSNLSMQAEQGGVNTFSATFNLKGIPVKTVYTPS